jgi:hypothetical protein
MSELIFGRGYSCSNAPEHVRRLFEDAVLGAPLEIAALKNSDGIIAETGFQIRSGHHGCSPFN